MNTNIQISRMEKGIIHEDLPFEIMEAVFEVHNGLGPGYSEGRDESAKIRDIRPLV